MSVRGIRRTALLLTAALGAAGIGAQTAAAAAPPAAPGELVATGVRAVATDGHRYATWIGADDVIHVVDGRNAPSSYSGPLPPACAGAVQLRTVAGAGQLALTCYQPDRDARSSPNLRLSLGARAWHELPAAWWPERADPWSIYPRLGRIGARRLEIEELSGRTTLVDLASGERRQTIGTITDAVDLDGVDPLRAMCAPLERSLPERWNGVPPFQPAFFDGTTAIVANGFESTLTAQRCGESQPTVLTRYGIEPQLGAGIVSYSSYADGFSPASAYLPACRIELTWAFANTPQTLQHTAGALWVLTPSGELRRIALPAATCTAAPQARLTPAGGGARTLPAVSWSAPSWNGATAERLPLPGAATPRIGRAGRALTVRTARRASGVTWQVGRRALRARAVGSGGRTWRFTPPRGARGKTLTVTARGVVAGGGAAQFAFALRR